jgi:hypothetical protein
VIQISVAGLQQGINLKQRIRIEHYARLSCAFLYLRGISSRLGIAQLVERRTVGYYCVVRRCLGAVAQGE